MKVLHVETGMNLYGGALQVSYLLGGLSALEKEQVGEHVLVCPRGSEIAIAAQGKADRVYTLAMAGDLDVGFIFRLRRIIRQERPDILHLHSRRGADTLGAIAGRLCGCRILLTRRVDNPEPRWWVNIKYRLYDRIVTISQGIRSVLLSEGLSAERVSCVPSAVDTQRFSQSCNRDDFICRLDLDQWLDSERLAKARFIGMVAQFIERKGHRYLLEAIPAIVERHPEAVFILFGKGPLFDVIREQVAASKYLSRCVYLPGFRDDMEYCLPCLDILAHPAEMEGLGVSLLQAAACAVPLVGADAGGIPEIVRENETGYLIPVASTDALVQAINRLLDDSQAAQRLGQRGRQVVAETFSIAAMVQGNLCVYRELLAQ